MLWCLDPLSLARGSIVPKPRGRRGWHKFVAERCPSVKLDVFAAGIVRVHVRDNHEYQANDTLAEVIMPNHFTFGMP